MSCGWWKGRERLYVGAKWENGLVHRGDGYVVFNRYVDTFCRKGEVPTFCECAGVLASFYVQVESYI